MEIGLWVTFSVAMLLMRASLAVYLCGLSRSRNAVSTLFRSAIESSLAILGFWAVGLALWRHSSVDLFNHGGQLGPPALFAACLCVFAAGLAMAPTVERSRPIVWMLGTLLSAAIVTPLAWRWAWSSRLAGMGYADSAGGSFIYFAAGIVGAVAALAVGPRDAKYNRDGSTNVLLGHNGVLVSLGLLLMFALWPAAIAGCLLQQTDANIAQATLNTLLCASAATVVAAIYSQVRYRKFDVLLIYCGLLGGLVSIAAAPGGLTSLLAVWVGIIAGIAVPWLEVKLDLGWKIDDPSGMVAVCIFGGFWGTLVAALATPHAPAEILHRVGVQMLGLAAIGGLSLASSGLVFFGLRAVMRLRVKEADELDGLDLAHHDLNAYPDFQQTMIKSYHLREM
jgi:ammonium transporter, Amt family